MTYQQLYRLYERLDNYATLNSKYVPTPEVKTDGNNKQGLVHLATGR